MAAALTLHTYALSLRALNAGVYVLHCTSVYGLCAHESVQVRTLEQAISSAG
jgi:hypothetical protein